MRVWRGFRGCPLPLPCYVPVLFLALCQLLHAQEASPPPSKGSEHGRPEGVREDPNQFHVVGGSFCWASRSFLWHGLFKLFHNALYDRHFSIVFVKFGEKLVYLLAVFAMVCSHGCRSVLSASRDIYSASLSWEESLEWTTTTLF